MRIKVVCLLMLLLGGCFILPPEVYAQMLVRNIDKKVAKQHIDSIMTRAEFKTEIEIEQYKWDSKSSNMLPAFGSIGGGFAQIMEFLLWGLVIAVIVWLIVGFLRFDFKKNTNTPVDSSNNAPGGELYVFNPTYGKLPDDIVGAIKSLWSLGKKREAMAMLYQAGLQRLARRLELNIPSSATESECVDMIGRHVDPKVRDYFRGVTQHWIKVAYANKVPSDQVFQDLCTGWREHSFE